MAHVLAIRKHGRGWYEKLEFRCARTFDDPFKQIRKGEENNRKHKQLIGAPNLPFVPWKEDNNFWHLNNETVFWAVATAQYSQELTAVVGVPRFWRMKGWAFIFDTIAEHPSKTTNDRNHERSKSSEIR
jgi:hypothetical protein